MTGGPSDPAAPTRRRTRPQQTAGASPRPVNNHGGASGHALLRGPGGFTQRLIASQRELYAADVPFIETWRTAMHYLVSEDVTYEKIWLELQALAWNKPELREHLTRVNAEWRAVLMEAFEQPHRELAIEMPLEAFVSLVMTFNLGIMVERLGGIETGHGALLDWIDGFFA